MKKKKLFKNKNWKEVKDKTPEELVDLVLDGEFEDEEDLQESKPKKEKAIKAKEPKVIPTFLRPESNPNGANQWLLDPRQLKMWEYYVNVKDKETFGNAYKSGIKAGYTKQTSLRITDENWFTEKLRRHNLYSKGVKVLDEVMQTEHIEKKVGAFGYIIDPVNKEYVYGVNPSILALKLKAGTFVTERLGKDDGFSTRNELTGKDGKDLPQPILGGLPKEEIERINQSE